MNQVLKRFNSIKSYNFINHKFQKDVCIFYVLQNVKLDKTNIF